MGNKNRIGYLKSWIRNSGLTLFCTFLWILSNSLADGQQHNFPLHAIQKVAETFGQTIYEKSAKATALTDLRTDYLLMEPKIHALDGPKIIHQMKHSLEKMLKKKVNAVKRIAKIAELAHKSHIFNPKLQIEYHESKKLNVTEFELVPNEHFNNISVNLTMSTIHVPTSVYDQASEVVNGVAWSEVLDFTFRRNYEEDPTLTWQFFGSASGFLRMYPGTVWQTGPTIDGKAQPDIYDSRLQNWYIQAANTPKDVIILLDTSGSMKGANIDIAKETVRRIISTLGENDFFNVITFSTSIKYLIPCLNGTLVPANALNTKKMIRSMDRLETTNIAKHNLALAEAFDVFISMNGTSRSSECNRIIMLITDRLDDPHHDLMNKYASVHNQIRIFSYMVGTQNHDSKALRQISCNHRGYFSRISSVIGIHEKIQDYIHVVSRPMILNKADHITWTNTYMDTAGLEHIITVSRPVYDNATSNGELIGVAGTDVTIKELKKAIQHHKLGHEGYTFIVNNRGHVVFHPDLKAMKGKVMGTVDIDELEQSDISHSLREKMIARDTGHLRGSQTRTLYDNSKRTVLKEKLYYFTEIKDTPFSLGLCLLNGHGLNWVESARKLEDVDLSSFRTGDLTFAPWPYCQISNGENKPVDQLIQYLMYGKDADLSYVYRDRCNDDLIKGLLFDAEATRSAYTTWMKENWDDSINDIVSTNGMELVFIGTKGGLTRYLPLVPHGKNLTEQDFIEKHRSTVEEIYYKRAVNNGEEVFTYSIPFDAGKKLAAEELMVTASTPIYLSEHGRDAAVAAVGLQMKYNAFYDTFMNSSRHCNGKEGACAETCLTDQIDCYLLDENGYVILSENLDDLGKFFGSLAGSSSLIMEKLIIDPNQKQDPVIRQGVFRRTRTLDYQALCDIWKNTSSGCESLFINPVKHIYYSTLYILHEIVLMALEFNLLSLWNGLLKLVGAQNDTNLMLFESTPDRAKSRSMVSHENTVNLLVELGRLATDQAQVEIWRNECVDQTTADGDSALQFYNCLLSIKRRYEPGVIGHKSCIKAYTHYTADAMRLPYIGSLDKCDICTKSFSVNNVPRTNLMLLAVDSVCICNSQPALNVAAEEISYNDSVVCQKYEESVRREHKVVGGNKRYHPTSTGHCYAYHPLEKPGECGGAHTLRPSNTLLILLSTLILLSQLPQYYRPLSNHRTIKIDCISSITSNSLSYH